MISNTADACSRRDRLRAIACPRFSLAHNASLGLQSASVADMSGFETGATDGRFRLDRCRDACAVALACDFSTFHGALSMACMISNTADACSRRDRLRAI